MPDGTSRKLRAILFADIEGYTARMQRDEELARSQIHIFRDALRQETEKHEGQVINFYGDGCICIFESSVRALEAAREMQKLFIVQHIPVRIGLHSGDIYFEEDNIYGNNVNIASRLESMAIPGSVVFSSRVRKDVSNQALFEPVSLGFFEFKNLTDPIEVFALKESPLIIPDQAHVNAKLKKQQKPGLKKYTTNPYYLIVASLIILTIVLLGPFNSSFLPASLSGSTKTNTMAIMHFDNNTGNAEFDLVASMVANRIVHGLTQNNLGNVVTEEMVDGYKNIALGSSKPMTELDMLRSQLSVDEIINGNIYLKDEHLQMECVITNTDTRKVVMGLPVVSCAQASPMDCVEEMRELILGYAISTQDRDLNLLLETSPPNFEAYKQLLMAKEAETLEEGYKLLVRSTQLDTNYFEPKVLLISNLYNQSKFEQADSLRQLLLRKHKKVDARQKNLLNFYSALLEGKNNLIYEFFHNEWELAPLHLTTNVTMIVLALQFIIDFEEADKLYASIDEDKLDYASCSDCRTRLYLKMYMDLERNNPGEAIKTGNLLLRNNGEDWAVEMLTRAYAQTDSLEKLEYLINTYSKNDAFDLFSLDLDAAREYYLLNNLDRSKYFAKKAVQNTTETTSLMRQAEAHYFLGDLDGSKQLFEQAIQQKDNYMRSHSFLIAFALQNGNEELVQKYINSLESERKPYEYGEVDYFLARAYGLANMKKEAIQYLEQSFAQGHRNSFFEFQNDYAFKSIRDSKEFTSVLKYWTLN